MEPVVKRRALLDELLHLLGTGPFPLWPVAALVRHAVERDVDGRLLPALAPNAHHLVLFSLIEKATADQPVAVKGTLGSALQPSEPPPCARRK